MSVPDELKVLSIFTDVFDNFLRYAAQILLEACGLPGGAVLERVAACIHAYGRRHPELAEKLAQHDLFQPEFRHSCLNRAAAPQQPADGGSGGSGGEPDVRGRRCGTRSRGSASRQALVQPVMPVVPATPAEPEAKGR